VENATSRDIVVIRGVSSSSMEGNIVRVSGAGRGQINSLGFQG
jgi:hypothetical protein